MARVETLLTEGDDGKGGDVGSGSSDDKGSPSGGGGGSKGGDKLLCPKCGAPCEHVATFITSTRFVKCEACSHFFVVLSEADQRVKVKDVKQAEQGKSVSMQGGSHLLTLRRSMSTSTTTSLVKNLPRKLWQWLCITITRGSTTTYLSIKRWTRVHKKWQSRQTEGHFQRTGTCCTLLGWGAV